VHHNRKEKRRILPAQLSDRQKQGYLRRWFCKRDMHCHLQAKQRHYLVIVLSFMSTLLMILSACNSANTASPTPNNVKTPTTKQLLTFPNVGTSDITTLDPATDADPNSMVAINMLYSGLVATDKNLNVIPDQATWQISSNNTVYTFLLNPTVTFSDGTPVTAQSYIYTWTRALLPQVASPIASTLEASIGGANAVSNQKTTTISGLKAVSPYTLQVTLTQPTPYFLAELTNALFFPLNQKVIEQYGQKNWSQSTIMAGIGTGPFQLKRWDHNVKMVFTPNPHYYGSKVLLAEVDMIFVNDPMTAYQFYRAGRLNFVWNIAPVDLLGAKGANGFIQVPLLETDALFFDTTQPPFDNVAIRQAFAYAIDKTLLATNIFKTSVVPASTILPPGIPGYQAHNSGLAVDKQKAKALLQSVYTDVTAMPPITFSYPGSQVSANEAQALQQMLQSTLQIPITLRPVELDAYIDETEKHLIQLGFVGWTSDFPDPYDVLATTLFSSASQNSGQWKNPAFDQLIIQAEKSVGDARLALYDQAENIAISEAAWLPLDHPVLSAVIPPTVHGVTLNGNGLYFGDWSKVYVT